MGRRKIEIQPITNERNRSVTFLKRKTGLFKKAYELGVLCSVDVAVIIFERRHGHADKLYQYCSGDVDSIVQRHLEFNGDRDTRTPHDFSGATDTRMDDGGDDDDEGDGDDGAGGVPAMRKRQDSLKGKQRTDGGGGGQKTVSMKQDPGSLDMDFRSPQMHFAGLTSSPTLPISSDRHTQPHPSGSRTAPPAPTSYTPNPHKRPRTGTLTGDDRPPLPLPASPAFPALPHSYGGGGGGGGSFFPPRLPRISQPPAHYYTTQPPDDLFAGVFAGAGGPAVGLEHAFFDTPLTFDWPQPPPQPAPAPSWLDFLSGADADKRAREGEEGPDGGGGGERSG